MTELHAEPRLLTTREVAQILRITAGHVQNLVVEGVLTPVRFTPRGHYRFRTEDVDRLIAGEAVKTP